MPVIAASSCKERLPQLAHVDTEKVDSIGLFPAEVSHTGTRPWIHRYSNPSSFDIMSDDDDDAFEHSLAQLHGNHTRHHLHFHHIRVGHVNIA